MTGEAVAQLDTGHRVESEVVESAVVVDGVTARMPRHHRRMLADQLHQRPVLVVGSSPCSRCAKSGDRVAMAGESPPHRRPAKTSAAQSHTSAIRPVAVQPGEQGRPIQVQAAGEQLADSAQQRIGLGPILGHGGHRQGPLGAQRLVHRGGQRGARTDFHEQSGARPIRRRARRRRSAPAGATCAAQYSGDPYPAPASRPVTLDTRPDPRLSPPPRAGRPPPKIPPSWVPSAANETRATPPADAPAGPVGQPVRQRLPPAPPPESTTALGPLTAAIPTPRSASGATSASPAADRHHHPAGRQLRHQPAPRRHQRAASVSDSTPATHAALISPTEWPITTVRRHTEGLQQRGQRDLHAQTMPAGQIRYSATTPRPPPHITSRSGNRRWPSTAAAASSKAWANTGNRPYRCRPIPSHCEPCPGNTNAVLPNDCARPNSHIRRSAHPAARLPNPPSAPRVRHPPPRRDARRPSG